MILVIMRMKVISEKRLELSQAIVSLIDSIRKKKGCRSCDFFHSLQNESELCLIEEWDTLENFKDHLKSELFKVVRGAMNLLEESCNVKFYTVLHSEKMVELTDGFCQQKRSGNEPVLKHLYKKEYREKSSYEPVRASCSEREEIGERYFLPDGPSGRR